MISHSKVVLQSEDKARVAEVLYSGQLSQGRNVSQFEAQLAAFIGTNYAVAVSSGTAALHLSLVALGIGPESEVILPSYVCTAPLNAIYYTRASPVLVDVDPYTYNIRADQIKKAVTNKTGAIIVPHMFGLPAEIDTVVSLGVPVIEDCAHSVGARFKEKPIGSFGALSVFSLYATKMLSAGEGGAVLSNDPMLTERIKDLRDYDEKEDYRIRYNYKLSEIHAALAIGALQRLPESIEKRQSLAGKYNSSLKDMLPYLPTSTQEAEHIYYRYVIPVEDPEGFMEGMRKKDIECRRPVFRPIHKYFGMSGYRGSDEAWAKAVSIPIYPSLGEEQILRIMEAAKGTLYGC